MRIAGPALNVSLLIVSGLSSMAFVSCASTDGQTGEPVASNDAPESAESENAPVVERAGAATAPGQDDQLSQDAELLELREQKAALLFANELALARSLKADVRLDEALARVDAALAINPDSLEARRLRTEILTLLGRPDTAQRFEDSVQEARIRQEKLRLDVRQKVDDARLAMDRDDYDRAVTELRLADTIVNVSGVTIDWNGLDEEVESLLAEALEDREAAAERIAAEERAASLEAIRERQMAETQRQQAIVDNLMKRAIDAFEFGDYDEAEKLAKKVQTLDPFNDKAEEIRTAAFKMGRKQATAEYRIRKAEAFKRWYQELETLRIPPTDLITLPDVDTWRRKSELRMGRIQVDASSASPRELELNNAIATTKIFLPVIEDETSLRTVMDYVRNATGLPIIVDQAAEFYVEDEAPEPFNFQFQNALTVEQALNRILAAAGEGVTWTIRYDAIWVTTIEKALGEPVTKVHQVKDLTFGLTDFIAPDVSRIRSIDEIYAEEEGDPALIGTVGDEPVKLIELDVLANLIRENVAPRSWDEGPYEIIEGEGALVITQSAEVQRDITRFLEDLRQFNSALVLIESKFLNVTDNFIQEIGNDFRGLDNRVLEDVTNGLEDMASQGLDNGGSGTAGTNAPGAPSGGFFFDDGEDGAFAATTQNFFGTSLGNQLSTIGGLSFQLTFLDDAEVSSILRAVEKSEQSQVVQAQMLSVHNNQRAYVTVVNQRAYIQDFDVEVAQFQAVADPTVNILSEGIVLDVRPTILDNRKWLRLEIQPTVANIVNLRNFSTTLGGNTAPVEFQLPELEVQSVNTSAYLPDGGSLLLGGLHRIRNVERRAEVPWIGRIPLLGFLFKNEGYNDERQSLMIVVKATITDSRETVTRELESGY